MGGHSECKACRTIVIASSTLRIERPRSGTWRGCGQKGGLAANTRPDGTIARIEGLEVVCCPVLILHPSGDRIMSREHAERFLAELPNAELRELPGCGHTAMFDDPELVATEILQFTSASA